ncbi:MAG: AbrB family transcriptional regulator [Treponema sp.]|jgi:membrane AbrB-like protein|nr:AbrB family transcriptional regulator [Treponema sp.]
MRLTDILLTLLAGGVFGALFLFLKIPNGLRIGAMLGSALLSIFSGTAYMPSYTRILVQVVAGALIGCTVEKSDIRRLPKIVKPTLVVVAILFVLNLSVGFLIHLIGPIDLITALMCVIPGGVTDTPIIAADMGADTPKVALAQLARYIMGVGFFPPMIIAWDNMYARMEARRKKSGRGAENEAVPGAAGAAVNSAKRQKSAVKSPWAFACTMAAALGAGILGDMSGIPAGTLLFAIIAVVVLKLVFDFAWFPQPVKKITLLVSGCYIGSAISMNDVRGFKELALPIVIIVSCYIGNCFITGKILGKISGFSRKEGMLIATPAGATDIALSSADMGIENTDVIIIQIFRSIIAITVFPQIHNLLVLILS